MEKNKEAEQQRREEVGREVMALRAELLHVFEGRKASHVVTATGIVLAEIADCLQLSEQEGEKMLARVAHTARKYRSAVDPESEVEP
jgi:hypothetical protein